MSDEVLSPVCTDKFHLRGLDHLLLPYLIVTTVGAYTQDRREGGVTRVVTRGPGALRGPVENKVCIFGYEFSISSIGRAGP